MFLKSIKFSQFDNTKDEWNLEECPFSKINLIVGKNSYGKTKSLNIINALSKLFATVRKLPYKSGHFQVTMDENGSNYKYILDYENNKIENEILMLEDEVIMKRESNGEGVIDAVEAKIKKMKFKTPVDVLSAQSKRDSLQHPFLESICRWAENTIMFSFSSPMGKNQFYTQSKDSDQEYKINQKETNEIVDKFLFGRKEFGNDYVNLIKKDMNGIGYDLEWINAGPPKSIKFKGAFVPDLIGIIVKEKDLDGETDQHEMSQGMFRALSLFIQVNLMLFIKEPYCILIDDIGEGLDYDRSTKLIKRIIDKAQNNNIQLIMATNDRFVMNNVPLMYWSIIHRIGNSSKIFNLKNSKKTFEDFEIKGLNNFDFFTSNLFLENK